MQDKKKFIKDTLLDLVKIPSSDKDDRWEIIEYVRGITETLGTESEIYGERDAPALLLTLSPEKSEKEATPVVVLSGHLDTVSLGGNWTRGQGEILAGRVYGRGALDMKGPCVSMLAAAMELSERNIPFALAFTTDEETTMRGASHLAEADEIKNAGAIVICEPTNFRIMTAEKGVSWFKLRVSGKAAHASMPQQGYNAIMAMNALLNEVADLAGVPENVLDDLTLNVGTIKGGEKINVVPEMCETEIDIRRPSRYSNEDVVALLNDRFGRAGIEYDLVQTQSLAAVSVDKDLPEIRLLREIAGTETSTVPYATEMVKFHPKNPRTAIFGPGYPELAHKPDEYIELKDLLDASDFYVKYAERLHARISEA